MTPSPHPSRRRGRPPDRMDAVLAHLCRRLADGAWAPGERLPPPAAVPVVRLGYDFRDLIRDATDSIAARRTGQPTPDRKLFPALLEPELESTDNRRP